MRVDLSRPRPRAGRVARRSSGPSSPRRPGCLSRPHPMFNEHCRASPLQLRTRSATIRWRGSSERSVSSSLRTSRALSRRSSVGGRWATRSRCSQARSQGLVRCSVGGRWAARSRCSQARSWGLVRCRRLQATRRPRNNGWPRRLRASKRHEPVLAHRALGRPRPSVR